MSDNQSCLSLVAALSLYLVMLSPQGHAAIHPNDNFDTQRFSKSALDQLSYTELTRLQSLLKKQLEAKKHYQETLKRKQRLLEAILNNYTQADKFH